MVTVIAALAFAVILALVYSVVAERFDDAGVNRRQFDAWIAIGAFGCWLALAGGDLTMRREVARLQADYYEFEGRPTEVFRGIVPVLRTPAAAPAAELDLESEIGALRPDAPEVSAEMPFEVAHVESAQVQAPKNREVGGSESGLSSDAVNASAPVILSASEERIGTLPVATEVTLVTRPVAIIVTPTPTLTRLRPPATPVLPTVVVPTPDVGVLPTATPHCGSPDAIEFSLRIEQAEAEREPDGLKVRYRARIENESAFPVTLADISITAQNSASGSEHYGHAMRPDITLAPFDRVVIEGSIPLTKSPSPFGRTELCFAMVGETCGERAPYNVRRRCSVVDGF